MKNQTGRKTTELIKRKRQARNPQQEKEQPLRENPIPMSPRNSSQGLQKYLIQPMPILCDQPQIYYKHHQNFLTSRALDIFIAPSSPSEPSLTQSHNCHQTLKHLQTQNLRLIEKNLHYLEEKQLLRQYAGWAKEALENYQVTAAMAEVDEILKVLEYEPVGQVREKGKGMLDGQQGNKEKSQSQEMRKRQLLENTIEEIKQAILSTPNNILQNTKSLITQSNLLSPQQLSIDLNHLSTLLKQQQPPQIPPQTTQQLQQRLQQYQTHLHLKTEQNIKLKEKFELLRNHQNSLEEQLESLKRQLEQPQTRDCCTETSFESEPTIIQQNKSVMSNPEKSLTGSKVSKTGKMSKTGPIILGSRTPAPPPSSYNDDDMRAFLLIQAFSIQQLLLIQQ